MNFGTLQKALIAFAGFLPDGWATVAGMLLKAVSVGLGLAAAKYGWQWFPLEAGLSVYSAGEALEKGGLLRKDAVGALAAGVATNLTTCPTCGQNSPNYQCATCRTKTATVP